MNIGESSGEGRPSLDVDEFRPDTSLEYELLGWNYRMSATQASIGIGQLSRLDQIRARRNRNAEHLWGLLADLPGLRRQGVPSGAAPCFSSFFVELADGWDGPSRDDLARSLGAERVDFRLPYQRPLASHAIFGQHGSYPVAERICRNCLGFRVDPNLGRRDMDAIAFAVRRLHAWSLRGSA